MRSKFAARPVMLTIKGNSNEECLRKGNGMCKEVCPRIISGSYDIRTRLNLSEEYYYGSTNVKRPIRRSSYKISSNFT